jgi:hypothetical protein
MANKRKTVASVSKELAESKAMLKSSSAEMLESMAGMAAMIERLQLENVALTEENIEKENLIQAVITLFQEIKVEWEGKNGWNKFWISVKYIGRIFELFQKVFTDKKMNSVMVGEVYFSV